MSLTLDSRTLRVIALALVAILPLGMLDSRTLAEICFGVIDVLFLVHCVRTHDWGWTRQPWFICACLWWGWVTICSTPIPALGLGPAGWGSSFVQALVMGRFVIAIAALQRWVLATPGAQRLALVVLALACLWIGVEAWQQYLTGANIFGEHRWADGSLTGPFFKPRAGGPYAHLLFLALLPVAIPLLERKAALPRIAGAALAILGVATAVLIGQRMPTALVLLGLVASAFFIPRLRLVGLAAVAIAAAVLAATPIISPPTYAKLIGETSRQIAHFALSPYGQLYLRASAMTAQSPLTGWGFNGFRDLCPEPRFTVPIFGFPPTNLALGACNLHPHNFYAQAATDGGLPALVFFAALNIAWLVALARGLWRDPQSLRVGLFVGALTFAWPLASSDNFVNMPMVGWMVMILGLGLAAARR